MYKKELKNCVRKMIVRMVKVAITTGNIEDNAFNCMFYFDGMNDATFTTGNYDEYMKDFTTEDFLYIFKSLVEYRKEVR